MTDAFVKGWRPHVMLVWLLDFSSTKGNVYDILWALVFGFATLNILSLVVRRSDSGRSRLSMGEILAIMVVCVSVLLLGWELLNIFKIFPIKLQPR
ncbi:MAG: hypothetical protein ABJA69_04205 [Acidobacteriaceae bacterium]